MTAPGPGIRFRPLARGDLPLLATWLADPVVHRWWHHETSPGALERDFGPTIAGHDPSQDFVALLDATGASGRPLGLVQLSRYEDFPTEAVELSALTRVPAGAATIDYLVGEPELRGIGLGTAMIAAFVARVWQAEPDVTCLLVPVVARNRASWRALERVGFRRVARGPLAPDNPVDEADPVHEVLLLERPAG